MGLTDGQIYFKNNEPKVKIGPQNGDRNGNKGNSLFIINYY